MNWFMNTWWFYLIKYDWLYNGVNIKIKRKWNNMEGNRRIRLVWLNMEIKKKKEKLYLINIEFLRRSIFLKHFYVKQIQQLNLWKWEKIIVILIGWVSSILRLNLTSFSFQCNREKKWWKTMCVNSQNIVDCSEDIFHWNYMMTLKFDAL